MLIDLEVKRILIKGLEVDLSPKSGTQELIPVSLTFYCEKEQTYELLRQAKEAIPLQSFTGEVTIKC